MSYYRENKLEKILNPKEMQILGSPYTEITSIASSHIRRKHNKDKTKKRKTFVGFALRIDKFKKNNFTIQDPTSLFEPGSFPYRKYAGETNTPPKLFAVKVCVPLLHSMLPAPRGDSEFDNHIIDMYPTFYVDDLSVNTPQVGQLVRVTFGDLDNYEDPIFLGSEDEGRRISNR